MHVMIAPPMLPSQDFLGEILWNNFFFPNKIPTKYAPISLIQIRNKVPKRMSKIYFP